MKGLTDKARNLILFLFLLFIWLVAEALTIVIVNYLILHNAWFGFTFYGIDLRTFFWAWLLGIVYTWILWGYWEHRDYKKWKGENKRWLR